MQTARGAGPRSILPFVALGALAVAPALPAIAEPDAGALRGRIVLDVEGVTLADVAPVVVYLDPGSGSPDRNGTRAEVRQKGARFSPDFLVVPVGTRVDMPNDDDIYHNVFSRSRGNAFDLGLYAAGVSKSVRFDSPGLVRTYCSIHESMNGAVFVAPSRWFAEVDASGRFAIEGVPAGKRRLRVWSERLPDASRSVRVAPGETTEVELRVGSGAP